MSRALTLSLVAVALLCGCGAVTDAQYASAMKQGKQEFAKEYFSAASKSFGDAAQLAKDQFGESDPRFLEAVKYLAWVYEADEKYADGRDCYAVALKMKSEDVYKVRDQQVMILTEFPKNRDHHLGSRHENEFKQAISEITKRVGDNDPGVIPIWRQLAFIHMDLKKWTEAEADLAQVARIYSQTEGDPSAGIADTHKLKALLADAQGNNEEARTEFDKAIAMYTAVIGEDAPQISELKHLKQGFRPVDTEKSDDAQSEPKVKDEPIPKF